jgi:hypothetical protein
MERDGTTLAVASVRGRSTSPVYSIVPKRGIDISKLARKSRGHGKTFAGRIYHQCPSSYSFSTAIRLADVSLPEPLTVMVSVRLPFSAVISPPAALVNVWVTVKPEDFNWFW